MALGWMVSAGLTTVVLSACGPANGVYSQGETGVVTLVQPSSVPTLAAGTSTPAAAPTDTQTVSGNNSGSNNSAGTNPAPSSTPSSSPSATPVVTPSAAFNPISGIDPNTFNTPIGPLDQDSFVMISAQLDGVASNSVLSIAVGTASGGLISFSEVARAELVNLGQYYGTGDLMAAVPKGSYFEILCDNGAGGQGNHCANGGWLGRAVAYKQPIRSTFANSLFGTRVGIAAGNFNKTLVATSDSLLFFHGRLDGRGGYGEVSLKVNGAVLAKGTSYNDGARYNGSYAEVVPLRAGDSYVIDTSVNDANGGWIGAGEVYLQPLGDAQHRAFPNAVSTGYQLGGYYSAPTDGFIGYYGRSDMQANTYHSAELSLMQNFVAQFVLGWSGSYNYNVGSVATYFGSMQNKAPIVGGSQWGFTCDAGAACPGGNVVNTQAYWYMPTNF